jgi:TP901 family phage tail tape measure protein
MDKTILDIILRAKDEASAVINKASGNVGASGKQADKTAQSYQKLSLITAGAFVGGLALAVKGAADLQSSMVRLVSTAGESQKNLAGDTQGILDISTATATGTDQLSQGLYTINSAGYHGAAGLAVLRAAAEGAKSENADLGTTTNALTTILNDYHYGADKSVSVTNQMLAAVSRGKMNFQDFAGSLSAVLPLANAVHLSFAQVAGAEATMTAQGMSAQQSSQDLANTIRALSNPNQVAINEMQQLGLNSNDVSMQLGKKGLTGTLDTLTTAITQHMGPAGTVIMDAFNQSKSAAEDANIMLSKLPGSIQGIAKSYLAGTTSQAAWKLSLQEMSPLNANLAKQFATVADKAHGFNSLIKSGSPAAQTYTAALSKMTGGATGLNTALMLTGANSSTFKSNVDAVAGAAKKGGKNIDGWNLIQGTFNFQLKQAKEAVENAGKAIGTALLPSVTTLAKILVGIVKPVAEWANSHKKLAAIIVTSLAAIATFVAIVLTLQSALTKVKTTMSILKAAFIAEDGTIRIVSVATKAWAGVQWILNAAMGAMPIIAIIAGVIALIAVVVLIVKHWKAVSGFFEKLWKDVVGFFKHHIDLILTIVGGPLVGLVILIIKHWGQITGFFKKLWNDITSDITTFVKAVIDFFTKLPGEALHALGNGRKLLANFGKDIIQGLVNGVKGAAHLATDAVKDVGKGVVDGFKGLLGIHSPSTVFAEAGKNIGQGLAQGIGASKGIVGGATKQLADSTTGSFGTAAQRPSTTAPGGQAAPTASQGASNVNITVNIGVYAGTQTEKQRVATEMWQALMQVARSHNMAGNVPNLGIRPV